jgi:TRAP transporter TAXI family solute receptor
MVNPGTGLTSIPDMIKKRYPLKVSVGRKYSDPQIAVEMTLKAHGLTFKEIDSWGGKAIYVSTREGAGLLADNLADAYFHAGSLPEVFFLELSKTHELRMLPLEKEAIKTMEDLGFERGIMPPGSYPFIKEDIPTVSMEEMVICRPGLPEEVIRTITRAIWENKDFLVTAHKLFESLSPANMASPAKFVPFHPGAERFYREKGWLK